MTAAARAAAPPALAPFSLRDVPSFIERQFPVGGSRPKPTRSARRVGSDADCARLLLEGRKPLILVRAVVLGCLLPATDNAAADLDIFLKLMAMDDAAFGRRFDKSAAESARILPGHAELVTEERGRQAERGEMPSRRTARRRVSPRRSRARLMPIALSSAAAG